MFYLIFNLQENMALRQQINVLRRDRWFPGREKTPSKSDDPDWFRMGQKRNTFCLGQLCVRNVRPGRHETATLLWPRQLPRLKQRNLAHQFPDTGMILHVDPVGKSLRGPPRRTSGRAIFARVFGFWTAGWGVGVTAALFAMAGLYAAGAWGCATAC